MSRGKGRRGSLFGLLARYVLLFTLALFALAALALYLWDARMAQLFLLDILYHDVCALDPEGAAANQDRVARALSEKHL